MSRTKRDVLAALAAASLATGAAGSLAGDATTYVGSGNYVSRTSMMSLASGDGVASLTTQGTVAISTSPPSLMDLKCAGIGLMKSDGDFGSVFYCTVTDSTDPRHGFDVKGIEDGESVTVEVVGGGGHWAGASGAGTIHRTDTHASGGSFTFEIAISLPD